MSTVQTVEESYAEHVKLSNLKVTSGIAYSTLDNSLNYKTYQEPTEVEEKQRQYPTPGDSLAKNLNPKVAKKKKPRKRKRARAAEIIIPQQIAIEDPPPPRNAPEMRRDPRGYNAPRFAVKVSSEYMAGEGK